jgi:hypothetical protein
MTVSYVSFWVSYILRYTDKTTVRTAVFIRCCQLVCLVDVPCPVTMHTAHDMLELLPAALNDVSYGSVPLDTSYALVAGLTGQVGLAGGDGLAITCHKYEVELTVISGLDVEFSHQNILLFGVSMRSLGIFVDLVH